MLNLRNARVQIHEEGRFDPFSNLPLSKFLPSSHYLTNSHLHWLNRCLDVKVDDTESLTAYAEQELMEEHYNARCNDNTLGVFTDNYTLQVPRSQIASCSLSALRPANADRLITSHCNYLMSLSENKRKGNRVIYNRAIGNDLYRRITRQADDRVDQQRDNLVTSGEGMSGDKGIHNTLNTVGINQGNDGLLLPDKLQLSNHVNRRDLCTDNLRKKIRKINPSIDKNVPKRDPTITEITSVSKEQERVNEKEETSNLELKRGDDGIADDTIRRDLKAEQEELEDSIKLGNCWESYESNCTDEVTHRREQVPMHVYRDPIVGIKIKVLEQSSDYMKEILRWKFLNNCVDMANFRASKKKEEQDKNKGQTRINLDQGEF